MVKAVLCLAMALLATVEAQLLVLSPPSLAQKFKGGKIPASFANFGYIPYGHTMIGKIWYNKTVGTVATACEKFDSKNLPVDFALSVDNGGFLTPFMLADRGDCSFVQKVRNMEHAGAAIGIVIDNEREASDAIIMSDDGYGSGIEIPSMLITKDDGEILKDWLQQADDVELTQMAIMAQFDISRPDNRVEYDIWLSSSNDKALDFIQDFAKVDDKFGSNVLMTPHYKFDTCEDCSDYQRSENCFGDGKYCASDRDHPRLTGRDIITEDLRQLCIYKKHYEKDSTRHYWWDYMKHIHINCYGSANSDCSENAHKELGLDFTATKNCVAGSWEGIDHDFERMVNSSKVFNSLIEEELKAYKHVGTHLFPSVIINEQTFRGQLQIESVMNAVCAGFKNPPHMCKRVLETLSINDDPDFAIHRFPVSHVILLVMFFMMIVFLVLCCYRRHAKRQMKTQINQQIEQAVGQYLALSNSDSEARSRAHYDNMH